MATLFFSDLLIRAGIEPENVVLIRHALTDKIFRECYDKDMVYEYTCHQRKGFHEKRKIWAVFISDKGTLARFYGIYSVGGSRVDTADAIPAGIPESEAKHYLGESAVYDLKPIDSLKEYENRLIIDWGKSTRMWHQKGMTEKPIIALQPDEKKVFPGFEGIILTYDQLKEIIEDSIVYESWHIALSSVYAVYLITDTSNGRQYIGSAYGERGVLGRWEEYVKTHHGGNKRMKEILKSTPEQYRNFQFSILQILPKNLTDDDVIRIETIYKKKLLSIPFGMNEN